MRAAPALLVLLVAAAGCGGAPDPDGTSSTTTTTAMRQGPIRLEAFADGLAEPVGLVAWPGDAQGRLLVLERAGRIVALDARGQAQPAPFLDLKDRVGSGGGEQGLLGLAFVPGMPPTHAVVSYTDEAGDSVLARFAVKGDRLDAASEEVLLRVDQPFENHNGGHLEYGPDGHLYFGLGDGGFRDDPEGNGQNRLALLGKMLRLEVGAAGPYRVPSDNPFVGDPLARPEVWAYGLRNPWAFSFDPATGDLWIADVGQDAWEEVNLQPASSRGGENYGWNMYEGTHLYRPGLALSPTMPVAEYGHDEGCSITGGPVYRGEARELAGAYLFSDFCSGTLWRLDRDGMGWKRSVVLESGLSVSAIATDAAGEVYVVDLHGAVKRLV